MLNRFTFLKLDYLDLNYNIISLIDTLGLLQGIILGLLLIIINKKKNKPTLFLGLFIIIYALELLPSILEDLGVTEIHPELKGLPFNFGWLLFPLFYVYVQEISILSKKKVSYWTLIPGILFFMFNCILFLLKSSTKVQDTLWYNLLDLGGLFFTVFIGFKTLNWIKKHIREVNNQYSATKFKDLQWAKVFVILGLAFTFTVIILDFFESNLYINTLISTINIVLLYWISIRGILQQNVPTLISSNPNNNTEKKGVLREVAKKDAPKSAQIENLLLSKIEAYIINENAFTQPDLTITEVANGINEHSKRISGTINSCLNQNFNTYINNFRVEKAITLLKSDVANNLSIEGIANEVGFHSRSSFYTAFKKVTGTTPTQYKKA